MNNRKNDHIKLALDTYENKNNFEELKLIHKSISSVNYNNVDLSTKISNVNFEYPIYINAITGGTDVADDINDKLCKIANKANILFCFGSISPIIKDKSLLSKYLSITQKYDNLTFSLNVGADKKYENVEDIINTLKPTFLQVHLNTLQELIMPEGDRDFTNISKNIKGFIENSKVPIIVKEVGFGMSKETISSLKDLGVKTIDISGFGGTNFAKIENYRRDKKIDYLNNFGLSTLESMLESKNYVDEIDILASGGIKNALDIVKCLVLGAKSVGLAGIMLNKLVNNGLDETEKYIESLKSEIKLIMTLLDCKNLNDLRKVDFIVKGELYNFCKQRGIL